MSRRSSVGVADVRPLVGRGAGRHPVEPEQPHDVIESQSPTVAQGAAQGLDPRLVPGLPQPPGIERRQRPILPQGVVAVGRGADPHIRYQAVLPHPGIGTARIDAHRQVGHDRKDAGRVRQLPIQQPLQPGVVPDPGRSGRRRRQSRARRARRGAARAPARIATTQNTARPGRKRWRSRARVRRARPRRRRTRRRPRSRRSRLRGRPI